MQSSRWGFLRRPRFWWLVLALVSTVPLVFLGWALNTAEPTREALAALQPTGSVEVETDPWLVFRPAGEEPALGLILYPGGRVDPRAYAPLAAAIAEEGFLVVITPMPLNLAVFDLSAADDVIRAFPEIQSWAVGGHSLGGAMAARYLRMNPTRAQALVLWAAYPAQSDSLRNERISAVSIYGTRDGLAGPADIEAARPLLPADTRYIPIEGGNHAQFAWYGEQPGDLQATIPPLDQQDQIVTATVDLLNAIGEQNP